MFRNFLAGFGLTVIAWMAYNYVKKYVWEAEHDGANR